MAEEYYFLFSLEMIAIWFQFALNCILTTCCLYRDVVCQFYKRCAHALFQSIKNIVLQSLSRPLEISGNLMQSKAPETELSGFAFVLLLADHAHIPAESLFSERTEIMLVAKDTYLTVSCLSPAMLQQWG